MFPYFSLLRDKVHNLDSSYLPAFFTLCLSTVQFYRIFCNSPSQQIVSYLSSLDIQTIPSGFPILVLIASHHSSFKTKFKYFFCEDFLNSTHHKITLSLLYETCVRYILYHQMEICHIYLHISISSPLLCHHK